MTFVDFLTDNYIWIIVIILITIITIIGFLADKKRNTKTKDASMNNQNMNNSQPINMNGMPQPMPTFQQEPMNIPNDMNVMNNNVQNNQFPQMNINNM